MNQSECLQIVLIVVASFGLLFMLANYNSMMPSSNMDEMKKPLLSNNGQVAPSNVPPPHMEHFTEQETDEGTADPSKIQAYDG